MGRVDTIIDALGSSKEFTSFEYDHKHRNAAAWGAVTDSRGRLVEEPGIEVLFSNSRAFLGSGADSSVMRCTVDFDRVRREHREEMLVDMLVHEWYAENPEGGFASYKSVRERNSCKVSTMSPSDVREALVGRVKDMGFTCVKGRKFKAVASVSLRKIDKSEVGNRRQMHQEYLYGLKHPNLLGVIFAFLSEEGHLVQVEEWGGNRRWQSLSLAKRMKVCLDVARGVDYLHRTYGALHRDIKPSNVLISGNKSPRAKLADYSIIKMGDLQDRGLHTRTRSGVGLGTPHFAAPEQHRGQPTVRSDVYGLGALLYAYVAEKCPADQSTGFAKSMDPVLLAEKSKLVKRLRLVMAGCLQHDPAHRYSGAGLVAEDIESVLHGGEPQRVFEVVSKLPYPLRNIKKYAANVFSDQDHEVERAITAELVTQQPALVPVLPKQRNYAKGCGLAFLAALALGTCTVLANPYGLGDRIVTEGNKVFSRARGVYDSAADWLKGF